MSGRPGPTRTPLVEQLLNRIEAAGVDVTMRADGYYIVHGTLDADLRRLLVRYRAPMMRYWQKPEGCAVCGCPAALYDEHGRPCCLECAAEMPALFDVDVQQ